MSASPRSLIVTAYGLYARAAGGALPVSGLVRLLATLDIEEQAVRAAVSRLKRRGMLQSTRVDGAAGYALTGVGARVLAEGDDRIFRHQPADVSDGWVLCVFSIPESLRAKRHLLRGKLTWLGFGQAAPGVWIAPAATMSATTAMLHRHDLHQYASLFRADYWGDRPLAESVTLWWDLPKLATMYRQFVRDHDTDADADPLPTWMRAVDDWRRLPFLDPGLPTELLPADWPGIRAATLFHDLELRLAKPAGDQAARLLAPSLPVPGTTATPSTSTIASSSHNPATPIPAAAG
ncbi:PaaX family transcriptional regulator [Stackebrandtia endophytica]|uniref:PaaX family transcriptional regulator n=1 Tax=Stackebrandtia endophytica TaxID=1496996 RepID=A0A543AXR3_9ACTN|nr:PaaX family transcriptional regulator C-terminal domain-containing protein [Stackebrandtia endophytica]TQL77356.1 PaaX family transcriptional regulator [Stackebrandtia endophytica]